MDPADARLRHAIKELYATAQASAGRTHATPRTRLRWPLLIALQLATAAAVIGIVVVALRLHQGSPSAPPVRAAVTPPPVVSSAQPTISATPTHATTTTALVLPPPARRCSNYAVTTDDSCRDTAMVAFSTAGVGLAFDSPGGAETIPNPMRTLRDRPTVAARGQPPVEGASVTDLQWIDSSTVVLATADGLLRSDDAGATWRVTTISRFNRVRFASPQLGLAITPQDTLVRTVDGGVTYAPVSPGLSAAAIEMLPDGHAWAAGPAGIAASSNFGQTWSRQRTFVANSQGTNPHTAPFTGWLVHMHFSDALHGSVLYRTVDTVSSQDGAVFYHTSDGGARWTLEFGDSYIPNPTNETGPGRSPGSVLNADFAVDGSSTILFLNSQWVATPLQFQACASHDAGLVSSCRAVPGFPSGYAAPAGVTLQGGTQWIIADVGHTFDGTGRFRVLESTDGGLQWTVRYSR